MIKFRIVTKEELYGLPTYESKVLRYDERDFFRILNGNIWDEEKKPPFRDSYSEQMIKTIDHAEFVPNDWYSMITPYGRTCLSALSSGAKYGLTVIYYSLKGIFLTYESVGENVWKVLNELPIPILIALSEKECADITMLPRGMMPLELENYPYEGKFVRCILNYRIFQEKFENNILYKDVFQFCKEFTYHWWEHIDEILVHLDKFEQEKKPVDLPEPHVLHVTKIINHLRYEPKEVIYKQILYLIVEYKEDGTYDIYETYSVSYPTFDETLEDISKLDDTSIKKVVLLLDAIKINEIEEIEEVYYGAVVTRKQLKLYEKEEALLQFRDSLRKAYSSGKYTIRDC